MNIKIFKFWVSAIVAIAVFVTGCAGHEKTGNGLAIGAGVGALLGQAIGHNKQSTLIGAVIGGALGGAIGASMDSAAAKARKNLALNDAGKNSDGTIEMKPAADKDKIEFKLADSLMFERGSSVIPSAGHLTLDEISASLDSYNASEYAMIITGHTDSLGGIVLNTSLSHQRALAVANYLQSKLPGIKFDARGFADLYPLKNHLATDIANRRTEIQIVKIDAETSSVLNYRAQLEDNLQKTVAEIKAKKNEQIAKTPKSKVGVNKIKIAKDSQDFANENVASALAMRAPAPKLSAAGADKYSSDFQ